MKKIISSILVVMFLSFNLSFAQNTAECNATCSENETCGTETNDCILIDLGNDGGQSRQCKNCIPNPSADDPNNCKNQDNEWISEGTNGSCPSGYEPVAQGCCGPSVTQSTGTSSNTSVMGIECSSDQLVNGQCKLNIYDTLGIRKSVRDTGDATSVGLFVQDIVLSATFFIGTLVTIALIVSGIMYIFAASSGKDPANAKKGIVGSLVGLLIVVSSYVIIRLVQYIAKGF